MDREKVREALRRAFESRVVEVAEKMGHGKLEFGDAVIALDSVTYNAIAESFREQAQAIEEGEEK